MSSFTHPGYAFVEKHGLPTCVQSLARNVRDYVSFLYRQAGLDGTPPVCLDSIYRAFGMTSKSLDEMKSFAGMEGLAADNLGLVFLSSDGPMTRRRFTQAHELMEYFVKAVRGNKYSHVLWPYLEGRKKERFCDWGAARLLMPRQSFLPAMQLHGMSLDAASKIAGRFDTSLLATLQAMIEYHPPQDTALINWHLAHKPSQKNQIAPPNQTALFKAGYRAAPPKAVRVWWATFPKHLRYLAKPLRHKSTPSASLIARVSEDGLPRSGSEKVALVNLRGTCGIDARRISVGEKQCVVSLFRLPRRYAPQSSDSSQRST